MHNALAHIGRLHSAHLTSIIEQLRETYFMPAKQINFLMKKWGGFFKRSRVREWERKSFSISNFLHFISSHQFSMFNHNNFFYFLCLSLSLSFNEYFLFLFYSWNVKTLFIILMILQFFSSLFWLFHQVSGRDTNSYTLSYLNFFFDRFPIFKTCHLRSHDKIFVYP
jgi:hypothetical protein